MYVFRLNENEIAVTGSLLPTAFNSLLLPAYMVAITSSELTKRRGSDIRTECRPPSSVETVAGQKCPLLSKTVPRTHALRTRGSRATGTGTATSVAVATIVETASPRTGGCSTPDEAAAASATSEGASSGRPASASTLSQMQRTSSSPVAFFSIIEPKALS